MTRRLDLAESAQADIARLLRSSAADFGEAARLRYAALIATALDDLLSDPLRPTSAARPELQPGVRTYHLRHCRRRSAAGRGAVKTPRHLIVYLTPTPDLVVVLRVLHGAMDLERHIED
ncbi:type II toxin-antitoxin system RelE/ParE family toxin [Phenylobacterium sp.]|uniref:type II toxin-antitoxin system RelE/ParE family toxin n=1 Tax=Phenylobacterium sp. TaxID=1871053 RepID=UPI00286B4BA2|nr:type II toxin-antitoxin system RelE/ParE family toxin [Phenylobacterium sp.]